MLMDLKFAQEAAPASGAATRLRAEAADEVCHRTGLYCVFPSPTLRVVRVVHSAGLRSDFGRLTASFPAASIATKSAGVSTGQRQMRRAWVAIDF